jgi:hypothetical protein
MRAQDRVEKINFRPSSRKIWLNRSLDNILVLLHTENNPEKASRILEFVNKGRHQ